MKLMLTTICVLVGVISHGQFGGTCPAEVLKERFLNTTTQILLTGDEHFDKNVAAGFEDNWSITPFEFVNSEEELRMDDERISYLIPITLKVGDPDFYTSYNRYGLLISGSEGISYRIVADIRCDNRGNEHDVIESAYRAYGFAKIMQDFIQIKLDGKPVGGNTLLKVRYNTGKVYNLKSTRILEKTLLVDKRSLIPGKYSPKSGATSLSQDKFKKIYLGKVKFVDTNELEQAINERNPDYTYLTVINSYKRYIMVNDCETGETLYNGYEPNSNTVGISPKDVKRLSKSANGVGFISAQ